MVFMFVLQVFYDLCLIQGPPRPDIVRVGLNINSRHGEVIYILLFPLRQASCKDTHMLMIYGQGAATAVVLLSLGPCVSGQGHIWCRMHALPGILESNNGMNFIGFTQGILTIILP